MINNWLQHNEQVSSYSFRSIYIREKAKPDNGTIEFLQEKIITSYRNLDFYKFSLEDSSEADIRNFVLNQVIPANITQFDKNVRQGDWGEILSALIVAYFQDLEVPINKLQWKLNKDKAVFGTDLFAYNKGDKITEVYYYEIKTRLNPKNKEGKDPNRNYITVIAHNSLAKDESAPTESIAEFLSRLFFEIGKLNEAKKFKDIVKNPQNYKRNFEMFFIIESKNFDKKILDELNNLSPQLAPLRVTLIFIEDLQALVQNTWNDIESVLVKLLKDE